MEDILEHEPTNLEPAAEAAPAAEPAAANPLPVLTRDDLAAFGQSLAKDIVTALKPAEAPAAPGMEDWEKHFADQAAATATARMMEANKPLFAASIAEQVAASYGPDVKREIVETLQRLPGHIVANLPNSPGDMKWLSLIARGLQAERQAAQAPRSGGAGTVAPASIAETEMASKFWNDYRDVPGFTKEMAREMAREAAAG